MIGRYAALNRAERDLRALKAVLDSPNADTLEAWDRIPAERRASARSTMAEEAAKARHALDAKPGNHNAPVAASYRAAAERQRAAETVAALKDAIRAEAEEELWLLQNPEQADAVRWAQRFGVGAEKA